MFGIGAIAAGSDTQSNDTLTQVSDDEISLDNAQVDEMKDTDELILTNQKEDILNSNLNGSEVITAENNPDVLKEDNVVYISPDGTGDGSSETSPTKWANVVMSDGLTIKLLPGTYTNIKSVTISNQITLKGNGDGVILDGQNNGRFFTVSADNVVIEGIKFINGYM